MQSTEGSGQPRDSTRLPLTSVAASRSLGRARSSLPARLRRRRQLLGAARSRYILLAGASVLASGVLTGAWPASASASSSGQVPLNAADFNHRVTVGNGFVEASARQVVRTSNDVVYIITADDSTNPASIHVWKGSPAGIPTTFTEMDAGGRPSAYKIGSPDTRLDSHNVIQMAYSDETDHTLYYQTFDTATDTWGTRRALATNAQTGLANGSTLDRTGNVAIILDRNDNPAIAYTTTSDAVTYLPSDRTSGGFGLAETVASGTLPIHPALAVASTGAMSNPRMRIAINTAMKMITLAPTLCSRSAIVRVCCSRACPVRVGALAICTRCKVTARSTRTKKTASTKMTSRRSPIRPALSDHCEIVSVIR